jgi:hypothetical protein
MLEDEVPDLAGIVAAWGGVGQAGATGKGWLVKRGESGRWKLVQVVWQHTSAPMSRECAYLSAHPCRSCHERVAALSSASCALAYHGWTHVYHQYTGHLACLLTACADARTAGPSASDSNRALALVLGGRVRVVCAVRAVRAAPRWCRLLFDCHSIVHGRSCPQTSHDQANNQLSLSTRRPMGEMRRGPQGDMSRAVGKQVCRNL